MINTPRLLDGMPYTPACKTTPEYLRARMEEWRRQIEAENRREILRQMPTSLVGPPDPDAQIEAFLK